MLEKKQTIAIATGEEHAKDKHALCKKLTGFGYDVKEYKDLSSLRPDEVDVSIVITDFSLTDMKTLRELSEKFKESHIHPPLIYISPSGSFENRCRAVKLGGDAFVDGLENDVLLLDTLSDLLIDKFEHLHVLIMDDDTELADFYGLFLEKAGITVSITSSPQEALNILSSAAVDLVLLDFHMPECNGFDFANILRQLPDYVSLPIIFISTETGLNKITTEKNIGADEFLVKPVTEQDLLHSVFSSAQRARTLKQLMVRDSATGLLNHSNFKKELDLQVSRATRRGDNFSYALLDLDHFKNVNDSYGHAAGDMILKNFAHLLKSRLRHTDIIGRYGGEEFGVVLLDTPLEQAEAVINGLLKNFSKTPFNADGEEFFVTFSAGIADLKRFTDTAALSKAADEALYEAKDAGRKQVKPA